MRTVSFSNQSVRSLLNQEFVNTFTNTTGDPTAGKSIWHSPKDLPGQCARGVGGQNVQTIFMTPEGKIFHAANGFLSADDLLNEVKFAKELFGQIKEADAIMPVDEQRTFGLQAVYRTDFHNTLDHRLEAGQLRVADLAELSNVQTIETDELRSADPKRFSFGQHTPKLSDTRSPQTKTDVCAKPMASRMRTHLIGSLTSSHPKKERRHRLGTSNVMQG